MLDVQKERLRQLMASAILELWKKETGSLTSVFIEATVCITACNSRMTVIQLSDHFPGLIPEPPPPQQPLPPPICAEKSFQPDGSRAMEVPCQSVLVGRACHLAGQKRKIVGEYQGRTENALRGGWTSMGFADRGKDGTGNGGGPIVHRSLNHHHHHHHHLQMDRNNNQTEVADAEKDADYSDGSDKDDNSMSDDSEVCEGGSSDAEDSPNSASPKSPCGGGLAIPGTGFYTYARSVSLKKDKASKADTNDSAIQDMSTTSAAIDMSSNEAECVVNSDGKCSSTSESSKWKRDLESSSSPQNGLVTSIVDLSHPDADLLISSPQNYTDQVRDAIRSRLLKSKQPTPREFFALPGGGASTPKPGEVPPITGLNRPFDSPNWPIIKREKNSGMLIDGRMLSPPFSTPPLPMVQIHKNFLDSMSASPIPVPHSSLQQFFGFASTPVEPSDSKVFQDASKDADGEEKQSNYSGLALPFPDQKLTKFEGVAADGTAASNDQKTYKCGFCHKTFLFKSKYHEHLPVHTSARPFECHMCTRTYKYKYDLRVHLRTHLGIPTKSTICPFCSGKFLTNKLLRNHIKEAHREQQQISEEQCAQSLENVRELSPNTGTV